MDIKEADEICKALLAQKIELQNLNKRLNEIKIVELEKTNEEEIMAKIAILRGEKYVPRGNHADIAEIDSKIRENTEKINQLEKSLFTGLKELALDIPHNLPQIENNRSKIPFEKGSYPNFIEYMAPLVGLSSSLVIDDVEFHEDKMIVNNVISADEAVGKIFGFVKDIGRLSSIKMDIIDPEINEVVEIIHGLKNKEVWEAIQGLKKFSYGDIFKKMNITDAGDKKNTRNFITNLETTLKDKYPFIKRGNGVFEFSFFGSLVWNVYVKKYGINLDDNREDKQKNKVTKKELENETKKSIHKQELMNGYVEKDFKKILYGKVIKDDT